MGRKQRLRRWCLGASFVASTVLTARSAIADPTKEECINADESAQGLRAAGKLRQVEDELTHCVADSCPGPVRADCSERMNEVQRALPTVVLAVRSARGDDLTAVRVLVDGAPLTATLGTSAIAVDPGLHTFSFEAAGYAPFKEEILIREGEKERSVSVVLRTPEEARSEPGPGARPPASVQAQVPPSAPRDAGDRGLSTRRWAALLETGAGVLAMGIGGILGLAAKSQFDKAGEETGPQRHDDSVAAVHAGNVATVVVSTGGLMAASGAALWLTAPSSSTQVAITGGQIFVKGSFW